MYLEVSLGLTSGDPLIYVGFLLALLDHNFVEGSTTNMAAKAPSVCRLPFAVSPSPSSLLVRS